MARGLAGEREFDGPVDIGDDRARVLEDGATGAVWAKAYGEQATPAQSRRCFIRAMKWE